MAKIGLFYGSTEGRTEHVAQLIKEAFDRYEPDVVSVFNVAHSDSEDVAQWDHLIFGIPTWNNGQLQDDWYFFWPELDKLDLHGRQIALFGLGDQYVYPVTFLDAMGDLGQKVRERGGELVGAWPADDYQFSDSKAVEDGMFMGLAIDEDHEAELTQDRVDVWVEVVAEEFGLKEAQAVGY